MVKKNKPNWIKLENEYITTQISLRKLSEKYKVSFSTMGKKAALSKWDDKRKQFGNKLETKTIEKTIEKISDNISARNARYLSISDLALDAVEEYLKEKRFKTHVVKIKEYCEGKPEEEYLDEVELETPDTKAFANMIESLNKIQKGQRLGEGLLAAIDVKRLELENKKLKKEETPHDENAKLKYLEALKNLKDD